MAKFNYNVMDYGALGNGQADDTDAIQACIDDSLTAGDPKTTVRAAKGPIYLPSGEYRVTKPLRIYSAQYVKFEGDGGSSRITPVGHLPNVLDLNGVAYSTFQDFLIEADGRGEEEIGNVIIHYYDPTTALRSNTRNVFKQIIIQNTKCVVGLKAGKTGSGLQCDQAAYYDLTLSGNWKPGENQWWQHGLYVGDNVFANNLVHNAYNLASSFWNFGVTVAETNFAMYGGCFGQNGIDIYGMTLAYVSAQGFRSEGSNRFFLSIVQSSNDALYNFSDILWSADQLNNDGVLAIMRTPGILRLNNFQVTNGGEHVKVQADSYYSSSIQLNGVMTANTLQGFLSGVSPRATAIVNGYIQSNTRIGRVAALEGFATTGPMKSTSGAAVYWNGENLFAVSAKGKVNKLT